MGLRIRSNLIITNHEADLRLRHCIEVKGELFQDAPTLGQGNDFPPGNVAMGFEKTEELTTNVDNIGQVSGLVACQACVALPGNEAYFGTATEGALMLYTQLDWGLRTPVSAVVERHSSSSLYALETTDPTTIDDCFIALRRQLPEEDINDLGPALIPEALSSIKVRYKQEAPDNSILSPEQRKRIIRAFKQDFLYLTILSTSTSGNVHDDEIPLLAEWLTK